MTANPSSIAQALFLRCSAQAARLDHALNRLHRSALSSLSHFLGDDVAFCQGRLVSREHVPF